MSSPLFVFRSSGNKAMTKPPIPDDDAARVSALENQQILDTLPEQAFDRLVKAAAGLCETPIALVSLIDRDRQWFKARVGVDVEEISRELSLCAHAIAANKELMIEDALADERFAANELVCGRLGIRFYFGVPVHDESGHALGTLCVIDRQPRSLTEQQVVTMRHLARAAETELRLRRREQEAQRLLDEQAVTSLMLGEDADYLMSRTIGELEVLRLRLSGEDLSSVLRALDGAERLVRLCQTLAGVHHDGPRAWLEPVNATTDLGEWFRLLAKREAKRAQAQDVRLEASCTLEECRQITDASMLERVTLRLLDNAYRHSPAGGAVLLDLRGGPLRGFAIVVEDRGAGVPEELRDRIFEPFFTTQKPGNGNGIGLGLPFCRLAAEALGGYLSFETPDGGGARFRVEIFGPAA
jgi:signal transduction histidine kinase